MLGTGLAFVFFHALVAAEGPRTTSLVAYVAPAFSVVYGVTLLDERFSAATAAGLVLIVGGSWLAAEGRLPWRRRREAPADLSGAAGGRRAHAAASWPQAASMSRPRVRRTVVRTPRSTSAARKASIASRVEPR